MTEEFDTVLKAGDAEFAARITPRSAEAVRARGDRLLRRRRIATVAAAVAVVAAVGGGVLTVVGPSRGTAPPASATTDATTAAPSRTPGPTRGATQVPPSAPATTPPSTAAASCRSLVVPQSVKDAVTQAYRRSQQGLQHITPAKGSFYYGTCGDTAYAASRFDPTAGAVLGEQVQLQDEGGQEKYFTKAPDGQWTYVATDGFPRDPRGCAAIPQIPSDLARAWADCK
ncbi:hypothetical protein ACIRPX_21175 [Streptomyces sp. NPDC101225]|uniref:hypothetical protein n=1 Tax=Streptomyces sp. NPDC101225 TaxID=3366135 RepID=UPI003825C8DF